MSPVICAENSTGCIPPRAEGIMLLESVASVMITLVCFFGNVLVCLCIYRDKHLRSVPNLFVVNLAITNVLLSTSVWPFWTVALTTGKWPSTTAGCNFQGFQNHCLMTSLSLTNTLLGVNRYVMLVYPFNYRILFKRRNAYHMIVVLWFVAIVWAILRFLHMGGYEFIPKIGLCESRGNKIMSALDLVVLVVFNLLTIFCYLRVFTIIRKHVTNVLPQGNSTSWPPPTGPKAYYYEEVNFTKTCLLIFFIYGLSWLPLILFGALLLVGVELPRNFLLASWFLIALSCAVHPVINISSNKLFRKGFYQLLCSCGFDYEANFTSRVGKAGLPQVWWSVSVGVEEDREFMKTMMRWRNYALACWQFTMRLQLWKHKWVPTDHAIMKTWNLLICRQFPKSKTHKHVHEKVQVENDFAKKFGNEGSL